MVSLAIVDLIDNIKANTLSVRIIHHYSRMPISRYIDMSKLINCKYDTIRVFKCKSSKNYTAKIQHYKKICIQENKNAFIVCSEDNNRRQCGIRVYVQRRNGDFSEQRSLDQTIFL